MLQKSLEESTAGVQYTVQFINNSSNSGNMMIFQKDPDIGVDGVMSLAWFSKYMHPTTHGYFQWEINYNFVWAETGELKPGVKFYASQSPSANLSTNNGITLTHTGGAYDFINQGPRSPQGSLYIVEDDTVPLKQASVGIGMSGAGTFVVQAQPNFNETFTPHPQYWIAFGNYQKGDVLDIQSISNDAHIQFPPGIYSMTATLNEDNTWTIAPTSAVNAKYLAAKEKNPNAVYGA